MHTSGTNKNIQNMVECGQHKVVQNIENDAKLHVTTIRTIEIFNFELSLNHKCTFSMLDEYESYVSCSFQ